MFCHEFIGNKKANSETRISLFFFSFCPVKTFKYSFLFFFINTNTIIFYTKGKLAAGGLMYQYIDLITVWRIFDRICQKVDHHLPYPVLISKNISLKIVE